MIRKFTTWRLVRLTTNCYRKSETMDDSTNTPTRNGDRNIMMTGSQPGEQPPPNETMNRTVKRTYTQNLTIPILEKQDCTSANMWW